jgi:hypothetical protein
MDHDRIGLNLPLFQLVKVGPVAYSCIEQVWADPDRTGLNRVNVTFVSGGEGGPCRLQL